MKQLFAVVIAVFSALITHAQIDAGLFRFPDISQIQIVDVNSGQITKVDKALRFSHGPLEGFSVSWSPDSRYMAYNRNLLTIR